MKETILKKLTSRKYLSTLVAQLTGVLTILLGGEHPVAIIAGAVLVIAAEVVYCIVEGRADLAAIRNATDTVSDAADKLGYDKTAQIIDKAGEMVEVILAPGEDGQTTADTDEPAVSNVSDAEHIA